MAHALVLSAAARSGAADAVMALLNGGFLDVFPGAKPAGPGTAPGVTRLVRLALSPTAALPAVSGVATFQAIASAVCTANGDPTWARFWASDGTTGVLDATVGTADADVIVLLSTFAIGLTITVSSAVYTQPAS